MHPAMDLFFVLKSALLKHCTMQLSFSQIGNLRFSPQQPFSGCLIISDRNIWWLPAAQFHFWILFEYELNTFFCSSWIYKKSIAIQAVCRQDVNKIVGTSWTPPSGFLPIVTPFLANMWREYFSFNIWTVVYQSELEISDLDQNSAKTGPLLVEIWNFNG